MKGLIYIYDDVGVAHKYYSHFEHLFGTSDYILKKITAKQIILGKWRQDAALLVIPGGADLFYCRELNVDGNKQIKEYVEQGGSFLGICAGSYYASSYVEFDKGGNKEVIGARELAFIKGKSIGPILAEYDPHSLKGARAALLNCNECGEIYFYYNGGGYFELDKDDKVEIMAEYIHQGKKYPAIIYREFGKGKVTLSGVHFEVNEKLDLYKAYQDINAKIISTRNKKNSFVKLLLSKLI